MPEAGFELMIPVMERFKYKWFYNSRKSKYPWEHCLCSKLRKYRSIVQKCLHYVTTFGSVKQHGTW